jgi:hypothetical protein
MDQDQLKCTLQLHPRPKNALISISRRLARRGGVKRIAATIYDDIRQALKDRLRTVSEIPLP